MCARYKSGKPGHKCQNNKWKTFRGRSQNSKANCTHSKTSAHPVQLPTKINGPKHASWRTQEQSLSTTDRRNAARWRRSRSSSAAWSTRPTPVWSLSARRSRRLVTSACQGSHGEGRTLHRCHLFWLIFEEGFRQTSVGKGALSLWPLPSSFDHQHLINNLWPTDEW
jgi:hypothetical protein